jgi:adenylate cyclase
MDLRAQATTCRFDDFLLDPHARVLFRLDDGGEPTPVSLGSRAFGILCVLIERRGEFVSKHEIINAVWPDVAVEDSNLTVQMSSLRRVLDLGRGGESCIRTIANRGYCFLPQVDLCIANGRTPTKHSIDPYSSDLAAAPPHSDAASRRNADLIDQIVPPRRWQRFFGGAVALSVLVIISFAPLVWYTSRPLIRTAERPRLSLVIMPFENLSGNPADDYLADSVTGEVTSDLSRVPKMFVIARTSAESYRGRSDDPIAIGQQLGVRYLVKGSVRKLDDTVRVNAQLISTETGQHLWADRFEQKLIELSSGQEEIVLRIGRTLNVALIDIDSARSKREQPASSDAFDLILRARSIWAHPMGSREEAEKLALFEQALRLDPASIGAMTGIAYSLIESNRHGDDLERAARLLANAAAINPDDELVLATTGSLLRSQHRCTESISAFQRVLDGDSNSHWAYNEIGACLTALGRAEEAIPMIERANRLDPRGAYAWSRYQHIGWAMLMLGRDEEAINWTQRALTANPNVRPDWRALYTLRIAAADARLGHLDEAHRLVAEANHIWPYDTARSHVPDDLSRSEVAAQIERFQTALRLAGERDHANENADFGVASDDKLHENLAGLTPTTVPGATTIRTAELERFLADRKPIVIEPMSYWWGRSIPGAVGLKNVGSSFADEMQDRLRRKMWELTSGDLDKPIVALGWNSERFDGRNLALRLVALGYTQIYWYRGGREAWEVNGLPEVKLTATDW